MRRDEVKFHKYLDPDAACAMLKNRTFKWSSPKLFNDPFDFPTELDFDFDGDQLAEKLMDELVKLAYGPDEPKGNPEKPLFALSLRNRALNRKPPERVFRDYFQNENKELIDNFKNMLDEQREFIKHWRNDFAVLCLSEKHDNLLMWAHYAKNHTGCVLRLNSLPELDRPLAGAQKVKYVDEYPLISDIDSYVKHLTGQIELDYDNLFRIFAYSKSKHWKYEEEWRSVTSLRDVVAGFDYSPVIPEELAEIYLGCRIEQQIEEKILSLIKDNFPSTIVYKAKPEIQNYELAFDQIR